MRLPAGRVLLVRNGQSSAAMTSITSDRVGEWREDRLSYDGAPIGRVAGDLSRNLGVPVRADPAVAMQPFRGAISLAATRRCGLEVLEPVLGVTVRRSPTGWVLSRRR